MPLNARAEILLKTLVESYIEQGQPLGSRVLARQADLDISPATVRYVMADLEEMGLVSSPHTSAGRVPTVAGYRVFVDSLIKVRPPDSGEVRKMESGLYWDQEPHDLMETASDLLSQITHLTGVVMVPRREEDIAFKQIDFVSLSGKRVLVILVTQDGQVLNRVIRTARKYSRSELVEAANYFNQAYSGSYLRQVKRALLQEIQEDSETMQRIVRMVADMTQHMFAEETDGDELLVRGESNLMDVPELGDVRKLRKLFDAFSTKQDLLHLLDRSMRGGGINIFIGSESGYQALEECSVVTASYNVGEKIVGTLGVVGPTRMPYNRVIPIVDITAKLVSSALSAAMR